MPTVQDSWCNKCFKTTPHKMIGKLSTCMTCVKPKIKIAKPNVSEAGQPPRPRRKLYSNLKLTEAQVEDILIKRANGVHVDDLAKEYGVSTQTIWDRTRNYNLITISKEILMKWIDERVEEKFKNFKMSR